MGDTEEVPDGDIMPENSQAVEAVENIKMTEQYGNIIENKGSCLENRERCGNIMENKGSYAFKAAMLLKRKAV